MKILVITCWCGGQEYSDMTSMMLRDLQESLRQADVEERIAVVQQGVLSGTRPPSEVSCIDERPRNLGFAIGMNLALVCGIERWGDSDVVLCLNNDIRMPDKRWLRVLISELQEDAVCCPTTNYTSVNEQRATASVDRDPFFHGVTPAVCWLIPMMMVKVITAHLGGRGRLFPTDLGGRAWGEDNYTAGVWRLKVRPDPFKIVPRSWIHHLGAKTSSKIPTAERLRAHKEAHERLRRLRRDS